MKSIIQKKRSAKNVVLTLASALFLFSCNGNKTRPEHEVTQVIPVETIKVTAASVAAETSVSGTIEGATTVRIGFMVPGKVQFIAHKVGDFVSRGQLIASLEATNYSLNKQLAEVHMDEAADEYLRSKILHDRGSLSASDFAKVGFSLRKSELQQKLEARNLSDTKLYTPVSGVLLEKQTEVGEIINAGSSLFTVADISKVKVLAAIPESELKGLHIGQSAQVNIDALNEVFEGKITEIGALADAASRSFIVKITINNKHAMIRPGMIAEVHISSAHQNQNALYVPVECVISDQGNSNFVYVIDSSGKKAYKRPVSLGKMLATQVEILSGLRGGELVVLSGQAKLSDGAQVRVAR